MGVWLSPQPLIPAEAGVIGLCKGNRTQLLSEIWLSREVVLTNRDVPMATWDQMCFVL